MTLSGLPGGARRGSPVCLPDRAAEAFAGGGELVFEFVDPPLGVAGFGGAGVAIPISSSATRAGTRPPSRPTTAQSRTWEARRLGARA
ncbi:MAG: hypothetical protein ACRDQ4_22890 [Pseudonocardiaceae bacterium]